MSRVRILSLVCLIGIGRIDRVTGQDTLFDQPKQILLYADKPASADETDFRTLVTQTETRLRLAGFTVQSGSSADFAKDKNHWIERIKRASKDEAKTLADQFAKAHPPSTTVNVAISMARFGDKQQSFIYVVEVLVPGTALIPTDNSPLRIEMKDGDGQPVTPIPHGDKVHYAVVWLFKSSGRYGVGDWKGITDGAASQIDEFITEYLKQNPKK
jgi:hypothetical protein